MGTTENRPIAFAERALATSFDAKAAQYARLRPGYPQVAVDLAVPARRSLVLDLGAGTGKLTGSVLDLARGVIAVEPLAGMLTELHRRYPAAVAVAGNAEHIPLQTNTIDAVVVGQAFHWFDPELALGEIARVLRPGGTLSLLWNHDDETDPLFREVQDALGRAGRPAGGTTRRSVDNRNGRQQDDDVQRAANGQQPTGSQNPPFTGHPRFDEPALTEIAWQRTQSVDELIDLLNTYSYVIRATDETRKQLAAEVRQIVRRHQAELAQVVIPVVCQVWRSTCR
ncbi:MAG: class I SAM-dependent methyltransferase [Nakamurella sp.]